MSTSKYIKTLLQKAAKNPFGWLAVAWLIIQQLLWDRFTGWGNQMIDKLIAENLPLIANVARWILNDPLHIVSVIAVVVIVLVFILALRDTRKIYRKEVNRPKAQRTESPQETIKPDPDLQRFSLHLDENINELHKLPLFQITGNGLNFLRRIKNAPPFLGRGYYDPVIYPDAELRLTEYFRAVDFTQTNMKSIKGGQFYTITDEDTTWKIISKKHYGSAKFANQVKIGNPDVREIKTGMVINIPYIDTSGTLGVLPSEYIESQYTRASTDWIRSTILGIVDSQMISRDEVLPLLLAIFDAAQKTLDEEKRGTAKPNRETD